MKLIRHSQVEKVKRRLRRLYGDQATGLMERFYMTIGRFGVGLNPVPVSKPWDENDVVLITYPDMVHGVGEQPLATLKRFLCQYLRSVIRTVHLLPFYPSSSDDGFSVIDYRTVDPAQGNWESVTAIGKNFKLMFDLVLNHCSAQSLWFKDFVNGIAPARHYFLSIDPASDLSAVVRPRSSPLLTLTQTRNGEVHVWTTFSTDQVDLNWQNPDVLFEFLDIIFFYINKGLRLIRLDAVAFLWKELGSNCIHRPQTHELVKLLRQVVGMVAPEVILLTETNVPQEENISYFGNGDEAQMVYQFSLPPLLLHALLAGHSNYLTAWARSLPNPPKGCTYLNFTASHDGIGVRPLQGLLTDKEIRWLIREVQSRGGYVSKKSNPDGSESPYEFNITYFEALSERTLPQLGVARFLCSQAVALSLKGIPAVYFNSLVAAPNYHEGVEATGHNRTINRRKWGEAELIALLNQTETTNAMVFQRYLQMLRRRARHSAFHPDGAQEILDLGPEFFGLVRTAPDKSEVVVCLFNFTMKATKVKLTALYPSLGEAKFCRDILSNTIIKIGPNRNLPLTPYQAVWLT